MKRYVKVFSYGSAILREWEIIRIDVKGVCGKSFRQIEVN